LERERLRRASGLSIFRVAGWHFDRKSARYLRERIGDRLLAGVVLYAGDQALPFGERLWALPLSALWQGHPR
jgi:hypothetical protein